MSEGKKSTTDGVIVVFGIVALVIVYLVLKVPLLKGIFTASEIMFPYFAKLPNPFMSDEMRLQTQGLAEIVGTLNPEDGTLGTFSLFAKVWGYNLMPIIFPILLLVVYFGCWQNGGIRRPYMSRYTRKITREKLAQLQSGEFPYAIPAIKADVQNQNFWEGPWRIPRDYMEVAIEFGLIDRKGKPFVDESLTPKKMCTDAPKRRKFLPHASVLTLNIERSDAFHLKMLGLPWRGIGGMSCPIEKAFLVALMAMVAGPKPLREKAKELLRELARTYTEPKKPNEKPIAGRSGIVTLIKDVNAIRAKVELHEDVQAVFNGHAYETTVFAGMLSAARLRVGKLSPNTFLWLRPHNLALWEVLCAIGGMAPYAYSSTGFYHYINEKKLGRSIATAIVEPSTDNLEAELHKERWIVSPRIQAFENLIRDQELQQIENNKRINAAGGSFPPGVRV